MVNAVTTPATTARSVRAATEYLATYERAPGIFEVYSEDGTQYIVDVRGPACTCKDWEYRSDELGNDGCKHIRRIRMERGEIDVTPLLKTDLDLDPLLLETIPTPAQATPDGGAATALADGGLPKHLTRLSTIDGDDVYHCQTCGHEGDAPDAVDHHAKCPDAGEGS